MQSNCPACGAPVTDDARFCSHCGAKLPDNTQRIEIKSEIKIEDTAKLEEVRLKYQLEEKKRQEASESKRNVNKSLKVKLWVSWLICIVSFSVSIATSFISTNVMNSVSMPLFILFMASGVYAIVVTFSYLINKLRRK